MENVTKADLIKFISIRTQLSKEIVRENVNTFLSVVKKHVIEGRVVEIRGFGSIRTKIAAGHPVYNFGTKKRFMLPARKKVVFKFSNDIKHNMKVLRGEK